MRGARSARGCKQAGLRMPVAATLQAVTTAPGRAGSSVTDSIRARKGRPAGSVVSMISWSCGARALCSVWGSSDPSCRLIFICHVCAGTIVIGVSLCCCEPRSRTNNDARTPRRRRVNAALRWRSVYFVADLCVVGPCGSTQRVRYSCDADRVLLERRPEAACPPPGSNVCVMQGKRWMHCIQVLTCGGKSPFH